MFKQIKRNSTLAAALLCLSWATSAADVSSITLSKAIQADGMALGQDGNLYVASAWEGTTIAKIDLTSGQVSNFSTGQKGPIDITQRKDGQFFATNWQGTSITELSADGSGQDWSTVGPKGDGLAFDSKGNLWLTTGSANEIRKIALDGSITTVAKGGILNYPLGIAITEEDEVFVAGGQTGEIYKLSKNGEPQIFATVPGPGPWRIGHLLYANGRLFASGLNSNKIFEISQEGTVSVLAGSGEAGHTDGPLMQATFTFPASIETSTDGKALYVFSSLEKTNKLRVINIEK